MEGTLDGNLVGLVSLGFSFPIYKVRRLNDRLPKGPSSSDILRANEGLGGSYTGKEGSFAHSIGGAG